MTEEIEACFSKSRKSFKNIFVTKTFLIYSDVKGVQKVREHLTSGQSKKTEKQNVN